MFDAAIAIVAPVVGPDTSHQDCACMGVMIAVPDGTLRLMAEDADELEAIGWGILAAVAEARQARQARTSVPPTTGVPDA